jgi:malate synthase
MPDFLPETASIRQADWKVAPVPATSDRRVKITGPVDRKMVINALNSVPCFMADFEDANSPLGQRYISRQINLRMPFADHRKTSPEGKQYRLNEKTATLLVRPRAGLRKSMFCAGRTADFGQPVRFRPVLSSTTPELLHRGTGPYVYLPKMKAILKARLWNDCS